MKKKSTKKSEKNQIEQETQIWKDKYLRALADYQNLEKRTEEEIKRRSSNEREIIISQLLNILDNIERAEIFIKDEGLKQIKNSFDQFLGSMNINAMDLQGAEFDPNLAECIELVPKAEEGKIVEVVRKGYLIGDKVLRHAQVKVGTSGQK